MCVMKCSFKIFYSMFKGRTDVYSKRAAKPNAKTGKTGYYTQCWNFWKDGLCPKKREVQIKCADCANQRYKQLTGDDLMNHLIGAKEDCSDVIGIYPMLSNETCNFLVFDFDNHESDNQLDDDAKTGNDWVEEVNSMRMICAQNDVDVLVERSRSGKGAHIWLFFEEPAPAATAKWDWLLSIREDPDYREKRRRNGSVYEKEDGQLGFGSFNLHGRKRILEELLLLEVQTGLELISIDELRIIDRMWENEGDLNRRTLVDLYYNIKGVSNFAYMGIRLQDSKILMHIIAGRSRL